MSQGSSADWEMAIVLPLGAVVHQLQRIEAQLRLLNMKAIDFARERDNRVPRGQIEARLEQIGASLESVTRLVSDIEADISPGLARPGRWAVGEETLSYAKEEPTDDPSRARDGEGRTYSSRKLSTDWDD